MTNILIGVLIFVGLRLIARTRAWANVDNTAFLLAGVTLGLGFCGVFLLHLAATGRAFFRTEKIVLGVTALAVALYSLFGLFRYLALKAQRQRSGDREPPGSGR
jgi:hypothetical protein